MMEDFDEETRALIEAERGRPDLSAERKRAILEGARERVIALSAGPARGGGESGETPGGGPPRPSRFRQLSASLPTAVGYTVMVFALGLAIGLWLGDQEPREERERPTSGALVAGDAGAGGVDGGAEAPSRREASPSPPSSAETPPTTTELSPSPPQPSDDIPGATDRDDAASSEGRPARPRRSDAEDGARASDHALASERMLIEAAQSALARGDLSAARQSLDAHASRHPTGRMVEEREALTIRVLLELGREAEARRRAEAFDRRWPSSLLRGLFESRLSQGVWGRGGGASRGE